ncbi:RagB/SusD family nutrient uptake outer membrane protein [Pedobacter sp. BS3]|uniref:RagB/SusD family nutrient uptake outer membrane protein n=1 Tax=Pedobacter sp. BS3 TaxID=2567937 RepID=UPI0011EE7802|nr:RagB/SusD family nutrient uptake outer membrane protein [Pedobacter sp. BS3]TZF81489.1 RagB/SusD family nutrient uptake outer membrane protein [Pedobacter sp. BS3]
MKTKEILMLAGVVVLALFNACKKDFLEREPLSDITPENYLVEESQLAAYAIARYDNLPIFGYFDGDSHTDIEARRTYDNKYVPGQWKVGQSGGQWSFTDIFQCNYFLQTVMPRYNAGTITGNSTNIKHYIGEMYFMRAWAYFQKLQSLGDFPIIKTTLPDNMEVLTAASKRAPQTEVARFILSDLDSAILLMSPVAPDGKKNRLSKACAQLVKSRVALYEGTFLKYFKGTAFVPNGPGWPGKSKDYNASYNFPSGSIDGEIDFFLSQAMDAAKAVADAVPLVNNTMTAESQNTNEAFALASEANPFCRMFSETDLSGFSEVLLWRDYDLGLGIANAIPNVIQSHRDWGYTRGYVDRFVMANGLPIYAPGSGYAGDDSVHLVRINRDGRLWLFLAQPGQINILHPSPLGTHATPVVPYPDILNLLGNHDHPTGYIGRKGNVYDGAQLGNGKGDVGSIVFRAVEAYLNYMEACYEKNGTLDGTAESYWRKIRIRGGVDPDFQKTINATDLTIEAKNDWGVYSAGQMVDKVLYNIRRERSCELMGEGLRYMDLRRWRAMDQMINTPYHIEGFKLWGPMQYWYKASNLTYGIGDKSTVSAPSLSPYLRVYQKTPTSLVYNGYRWTMAHYFNPIAIQHFLITSKNNDVSTSPIYQNPGWPLDANEGPIGF